MKIVVSLLLAVSFMTCKKPNSGSNSSTKDFAVKNGGPNFALVSAYLPDDAAGFAADIYNWKNMFIRKDLGIYNISNLSSTTANQLAKSTDIIQAFTAMASQLTPKSTVVFTFSGRLKGGQLRLADGLYSFSQLVTPFKTKHGQRFYFLHDAVELNPNSTPQFIIQPTDLTFPEVIEFTAQSPLSGGVTAGRLATEFAGTLDAMQRSNPKVNLDGFFKGVVDSIARSNPAAARLAEARGISSPGILQTETLLASSAQSPVSPSSGSTPSSGNTAGGSGNSTGGAGGTSSGAQYEIVEISADYCGPCKMLAAQIANSRFPNCSVTTKIVEGTKRKWDCNVDSKTISDHSFQGSNSDIPKEVTVSGYPTVYLIDKQTGKIVDTSNDQTFPKCGGTISDDIAPPDKGTGPKDCANGGGNGGGGGSNGGLGGGSGNGGGADSNTSDGNTGDNGVLE